MTANKRKRIIKILELRKDIKNGMSWNEAIDKYSISRDTVSQWLKHTVISESDLAEVYEKAKSTSERRLIGCGEGGALCSNMNELEFIESKSGLGFKLFPMQRLIVKAFYGIPLEAEEQKQLEDLKVQGKTTWESGQIYNELVLMCGMKGGKTELISAISCIEEWKLYKLGNPQLHYGLPEGKEIYIINVAADKDQARDTIFASTHDRIQHSEFYQQRNYEAGVSDYKMEDTNVIIKSGHSSSSSMVGRTAILVMFDEIARFTEKSTGKSSGNVVYNSLTRSVAPFRGAGKIASLSSTMHEKDMINQLFEKSKEIKTMLGFKLATWEINPNLPFDCDFLQTELKKSPEDFWRDFGCEPSKAVEKYYRDRLKIDQMFLDGRQAGMVNPIDHDGKLKDKFKGNSEFNYYLHLDPAINNCSFGIALAYRHGDKVYVPLAHGFKAGANSEIDFEMLKEFIGLVIDRYPTIKLATFDSYIAASLAQYIVSRGVKVEFLSVQKEHHDSLKVEGIYRGKILTYPNEVLERELKDLELINGKKVDHPADSSKDRADAVAGAAYHALEEKEVEIYMGGDEIEEPEEYNMSMRRTMFNRR